MRRYNNINTDVQRKQKIIDDVLLYKSDNEAAFYHVFGYLVLCYNNHIAMSLNKLRLTKQETNFIGYNIMWTSSRPSDEMLYVICDSSMPPNCTISDIWS